MSLVNKEGSRVPHVNFKTREGDQWVEKTTDDYFKGKKVVLFALPGAFTPTCSSTHLPRYNELHQEFKKLGIDDVICLSVNDSFVMNAWKREQKADNITMLPDGNGEFSKDLGLLVNKNDLGLGDRSWRYSMLVNDGVVEKMFIEEELPGDPFQSSDADTMLKYLNPEVQIPKSIALFSREGCPYCYDAKELLKKHELDFEEHCLNKDYSLKTILAVSGVAVFPQIFINGEKIGGYTELKALLEN